MGVYRRRIVVEVQGTDRAPLCRSCIAALNEHTAVLHPEGEDGTETAEVLTHRVSLMAPPYENDGLPRPRCRRCELKYDRFTPATALCLVEYLTDGVSLCD